MWTWDASYHIIHKLVGENNFQLGCGIAPTCSVKFFFFKILFESKRESTNRGGTEVGGKGRETISQADSARDRT